MKLSELIAKVGDDKVQIQNLQSSLIKGKKCKKDGELTFATSLPNTDSAMRAAAGIHSSKIGIVLWIDRENYEKATAQTLNERPVASPVMSTASLGPTNP